MAQARLPLIRQNYGQSWFIPALYGRPAGDSRLFDASQALPTLHHDPAFCEPVEPAGAVTDSDKHEDVFAPA